MKKKIDIQFISAKDTRNLGRDAFFDHFYSDLANIYASVTLLLEKQHKEFNSDKPICPL